MTDKCGHDEQNENKVLELTDGEAYILLRLSEIPFLPVGKNKETTLPVSYFCDMESGKMTDSILGLKVKRLITVDYNKPISGYDYSEYKECSLKGSMAFTETGQKALDIIEKQYSEKEINRLIGE